jgi:hypothetical protein
MAMLVIARDEDYGPATLRQTEESALHGDVREAEEGLLDSRGCSMFDWDAWESMEEGKGATESWVSASDKAWSPTSCLPQCHLRSAIVMEGAAEGV